MYNVELLLQEKFQNYPEISYGSVFSHLNIDCKFWYACHHSYFFLLFFLYRWMRISEKIKYSAMDTNEQKRKKEIFWQTSAKSKWKIPKTKMSIIKRTESSHREKKKIVYKKKSIKMLYTTIFANTPTKWKLHNFFFTLLYVYISFISLFSVIVGCCYFIAFIFYTFAYREVYLCTKTWMAKSK